MARAEFLPLTSYKEYSPEEMLERSKHFYDEIKKRRTVREFDTREVNEEIIKNCLLAAGTAPNGANLQPWHFVVVRDKKIKAIIRQEAEKEELAFYKGGKAPQEWLDALAHLGTDENKPFLEEAPYLIVIFAKSYDFNQDGSKTKNYYVQESVGIATGILITALHEAGLSSLTHTPSPMGFLNEILDRPKNERPYMILVAGYPKKNVTVPNIQKKKLNEIATFK